MGLSSDHSVSPDTVVRQRGLTLKGLPFPTTPKRRADPDDKSDGRDDDDALLCRRLLSSSHGPKSTVSAPSQKSVSQSVPSSEEN